MFIECDDRSYGLKYNIICLEACKEWWELLQNFSGANSELYHISGVRTRIQAVKLKMTEIEEL